MRFSTSFPRWGDVEKCGVGCECYCGDLVEKCGYGDFSDFYELGKSTWEENVESEVKKGKNGRWGGSYPCFTQSFTQVSWKVGRFSTGLESGGKRCWDEG